MNRKVIIALGIISILVSSCINTGTGPALPNVKGKSGSILIIIDEQNWEGKIGDELRTTFSRPITTLPQPEPMFNIIQVTAAGFSNTFKPFRNILITRVSDEYNKAYFQVEKDLWSENQLVIKAFAPTKERLLQVIRSKSQEMVNLFKNIELERWMNYQKKNLNKEAVNRLAKKHSIHLNIPKGYNIDSDTNDFVWIAHEAPTTSQGILLYYYDYDKNQKLTKDFLLKKRNSYLKKYVPGEHPGSYMSTENQFPPIAKEFTYNNRFFIELKGLWKLEGEGFMGGPFINLTTIDTINNRIVTTDGYVYAPNQDKKSLYWQVEAILYSLQIPEK
jgi:hypothetical protein